MSTTTLPCDCLLWSFSFTRSFMLSAPLSLWMSSSAGTRKKQQHCLIKWNIFNKRNIIAKMVMVLLWGFNRFYMLLQIADNFFNRYQIPANFRTLLKQEDVLYQLVLLQCQDIITYHQQYRVVFVEVCSIACQNLSDWQKVLK